VQISEPQRRASNSETYPGTGRSKEGATINATVEERDSDMGNGAVYHDNRVRVDRAGGKVL
jgi:hypothetical protein